MIIITLYNTGCALNIYHSHHQKMSSSEINSAMPATAQAVNTSYSYKIDMWDKFSELIDKLMVSKADVKQFQALVKETYALYETIGKKLCKTKLTTATNSL